MHLFSSLCIFTPLYALPFAFSLAKKVFSDSFQKRGILHPSPIFEMGGGWGVDPPKSIVVEHGWEEHDETPHDKQLSTAMLG
jgi:hypothetical protein